MSSQKDLEAEKTGRIRRVGTHAYGQRRRFATVAAGLLTVALAYHVVFGQNGLTAYMQKKQDARILSQQVKALTAENEELKGHVERLANDPGAIEHQAREELHYTRPGEVIITLPLEAPASKLVGTPR